MKIMGENLDRSPVGAKIAIGRSKSSTPRFPLFLFQQRKNAKKRGDSHTFLGTLHCLSSTLHFVFKCHKCLPLPLVKTNSYQELICFIKTFKRKYFFSCQPPLSREGEFLISVVFLSPFDCFCLRFVSISQLHERLCFVTTLGEKGLKRELG